jgi:hypothetical protein
MAVEVTYRCDECQEVLEDADILSIEPMTERLKQAEKILFRGKQRTTWSTQPKYSIAIQERHFDLCSACFNCLAKRLPRCAAEADKLFRERYLGSRADDAGS